MSRRSATARACSGPAPPNAISAKSRGSRPRSTAISRIAFAMFSSAVRTRGQRRGLGRAGRARRRARRRRSRAALGVERHRAAEEVVRVEPAEHQVGVGQRSARCRPCRRRPGPARPRRSAARRAAGRPCRSRRSSRRRRRSCCTATQGMLTGMPNATWNSLAYCCSPLEHEADVAARAAHVEREDATGCRAARRRSGRR